MRYNLESDLNKINKKGALWELESFVWQIFSSRSRSSTAGVTIRCLSTGNHTAVRNSIGGIIVLK